MPIGPLEQPILEELVPGLEARFRTRVHTGIPAGIDPDWFDPTRNQYRAGPILDLLVDRQGDEFRSLGIMDADIFAPNLDFIFGQAIVGGCCAVIGLARLREEFYRRPPDPGLFARRTLTEAVHELGHTSGLEHCQDRRCVMNFSRNIEESDSKGPDFCRECESRLQ